MNENRDGDLPPRMATVEVLLQAIERLPDNDLREHVREIVRTLLDFHAEGLERMLERIRAEGEHGRRLIEDLTQDELIESLLLLHDLLPDDAGRIELPLVGHAKGNSPP